MDETEYTDYGFLMSGSIGVVSIILQYGHKDKRIRAKTNGEEWVSAQYLRLPPGALASPMQLV